MNSSAVVGSERSRAVTAAGYLTVAWGTYNAVLGLVVIFNAVGWFNQSGDPWWPVITLFGLLPVVGILIGVGFVLFGGVGVLSGVGVLAAEAVVRVLTLLIAGLAVVSGVAVFTDTTGLTAVDVITSVVQVLYGVFALVVLVRYAGEFKWSPSGTLAGPHDVLHQRQR